MASLVILIALVAVACVPPVEEVPAPVEQVEPVEPVEPPEPVERKLKAAWIYVGPIGDLGWTHAHNEGRLYVEELFPWLETVYAEAVSKADAPAFLDRYVLEEKVDVIFTTSFGYMDATIEAAQRHPETIFFHCSGFKRTPNSGTYFIDLYQAKYLSGVMAGALTKTNEIGYVAAHPIPEVIRHINAFTLGVREVNPEATVDVRWLFAWYDPVKAREAAEALIAAGSDVLAFTEDTATVVMVGEEYTQKGQPVYTFAHYSPMLEFGPNSVVSGQLAHWGPLYADILMRNYHGIYTAQNLENVDLWWLIREGGVEVGADMGVPINPKFEEPLKAVKVTDPILGEISVYDLVLERVEQFKDPTMPFYPFTGPIKDQDGVERLKSGQRATYGELLVMDYFVDGLVGIIPD
ncbi:BMP family ABC transporter substrate-binding protein [Candidatus Hakubella thermalkaliphila]|uniref:BMP family ABC transporter substrate-binding protein n=1 Tax=Candidatus Hakubella thermalkaliphila TaxID=2754717 RepID=UPI00215948E4|nr:BMP family ABC transporter substrate-binding protein [Candidatus Hakubella thermalkaliphila]